MSNFIVKVQAYYPVVSHPKNEFLHAISKQELHMADVVEIHKGPDNISFTLVSENGPSRIIEFPQQNLTCIPEKVSQYEVMAVYIENQAGKTLERFHRGYGLPLPQPGEEPIQKAPEPVISTT